MSRRRGEVARAAKKYKEEKQTGEVLSGELKKIQDKYKTSESSTSSMIDSAEEALRVYKEKYEESVKVVYPDVEMISNRILLTTALYSLDDAGMFLVRSNFSLNSFKEITEQVNHVQTVVAVGPQCTQLKKGDKISFSPDSFYRVKNPNSVHSEETNDLPRYIRVIDNRAYIMLTERDIDYIIKKE